MRKLDNPSQQRNDFPFHIPNFLDGISGLRRDWDVHLWHVRLWNARLWHVGILTSCNPEVVKNPPG